MLISIKEWKLFVKILENFKLALLSSDAQQKASLYDLHFDSE